MAENTSIKIRKIPPHHAGRLNTVFGRALENDFAYFLPSYRDEVRLANKRSKLQLATLHPKRLVMGVYNKSELIGYSISSIYNNGSAFLFWMYVDSTYRGLGLGKTLLTDTHRSLQNKHVDSISLVTHNQQKFYEHHGYELDKILPEYIAGVDMYAMTRRLV